MHLIFANPAGFWALLGIPAVLAIHFLQRESRRVVTSTLFLFETLGPISAQGRRFERLRGSVPLWLQLVAVALLTWLLAGPLWLRKDSTQRIVVVLDSSVSMSAFRPELARALPTRLHALSTAAARTEWRLLETDPARPTLYAGNNLQTLLATLPAWNPHLGTHDFRPALDAARSLVRGEGVALLVTDRPTPLPEGVDLLAVGHAIDNCGWIGVTVEGDTWHALVRNHSDQPQTRTWHLEAEGGAAGPDAELTLAPRQIQTLGGSFPPGQNRCQLVLNADAFTLDDRLPIVRPTLKKLLLSRDHGTPLDDFFDRLAASLPMTETNTGPADVRLGLGDGVSTLGHAILFPPPAEPAPKYLPGELVAEDHPLNSGLNWNGLLCKNTNPLATKEGDEVLLWQGERPLIFLRGGRADRSLIVNFDLRQSNADRLPAFVVLLHRFLETVRAEKVAFERVNVETNQLLEIASDSNGPSLQIAGVEGPARAPATPGFFEASQGNRALLSAAAHFADAREADFHDAASVNTLEGKTARLVERNSQQDTLWPVFALLLGTVLLANWSLTGGGGGAS